MIVAHRSHDSIDIAFSDDTTLDTFFSQFAKQTSTLQNVSILERSSITTLCSGVLGDLVVDEHSDAHGDGAVALDQRGEEVEPDVEPDIVLGKLSCLQKSLAVKYPTATEQDAFFLHSTSLDNIFLES